ncbi:nickel ABC transporter permease [Bifidobacterium subtile]|jgi:peptide/nickel transport system permease protein|uniref:Nickel import system permease protein NikB n=1 Tax=Bifidobacterium subtile TaxID=77635 RepID=A0A087DTK9_9BIFI|nr:nickel ABC transporter permease [Bifidobacterium subtile]KFI98859.1 peptide ABC transporter permease [Bifidobacterium subtile]QOL36439.1 ABC transporter permease [Bifidobacterium subtile]QOL36452.1 ABC transporter permease [Bifidobacterium subtile]
MLKYVGNRLLQLIPVLFGVSLIVFTLLYFSPGDPAKIMMGESVDPKILEATRESMGLNKPYWQRYLSYVGGIIFHFDFGTSYATKQPVTQQIMASFPNTLKLTMISMFVAVIGGVVFGVISALRQNTWVDSTISLVALIGISFPSFWLALLLIIFFAVKLGWFPASGFDSWRAMVLPCGVLSIGSVASLTRMTRSSMLDVIRQDYVRTAKAKGLSNTAIVIGHELKNALIPVITVIGMDFGSLLGGAVLTEVIFSIQGVGRLIVDSITMRDYPVVQGGVLFIALMVCFVNLLVDVIYMVLDPKLRAKGGK